MHTEESPAAARPTPTPKLNLYSAVWEAAGHMTDEEIVEFVKENLRDVKRDEP